MNNSVILRVENISKHYDNKGVVTTLFDNLNFEMSAGKVLGLIGRNGMGKTTLLKILAGIVKPSYGKVYLHGLVQPVIELGQNFHQELSGIENVDINLRIASLYKPEIADIKQQIIDFAELGDKLYLPVKNYSSGMLMRLSFALQTHLPADLILLDEITAVGDVAFQHRCNEKVKQLLAQGVSFIMASHDANQIQYFADECLLIDKEGVLYGETQTVLDAYLKTTKGIPVDFKNLEKEKGALHPPPKLLKVGVRVEGKNAVSEPCINDNFFIDVEFTILEKMVVGVTINAYMNDQITLFSANNIYHADLPEVLSPGTYRTSVLVPGNLFTPGLIYLDVFFQDRKSLIYITYKRVHAFELKESHFWRTHFADKPVTFLLSPIWNWQLQSLGNASKPVLLKDLNLWRHLETNSYVLLPNVGEDVLSGLAGFFEQNNEALSVNNINVSITHAQPSLRTQCHNTISAQLKNYIETHFHDVKIILATFFVKKKGEDSRVDFHHDPTYVDPDVFDDFSLWIPLQNVGEGQGYMMVKRGSHITAHSINCPGYVPPYLSDIKQQDADKIYLKAGQPVLFYNRASHASVANIYYDHRVAVSVKITHVNAELFAYYLSPDKNKILKFPLLQESLFDGSFDENISPGSSPVGHINLDST